MNDADVISLADEIRETIRAGIAAVVGPMQARIAEVGPILASLSAEVETLKARIEKLAKEPRILLNPTINLPPVTAPSVHVSPVLRLEKKPMNRTVTPGADGSFVIEDSPSLKE